MTDKEKAKAYDEALDRMKHVVIVPKDEKALQALKETIFPELCESEDEKIRKALIDVLKMSETVGELKFRLPEPTREKALAYLEKQKDSNDMAFHEGYTLGFEDGMKEKELHYTKRNALFDKCVENCDPEVMKEVSDKVDEMLGKEQKPNIEICPHSIKSKSYSETGYPIEDCDYGLEIALSILEKTLGKVKGYQTDDGIREHQTAIKAVKDAMKEQKPTDLPPGFYFIDLDGNRYYSKEFRYGDMKMKVVEQKPAVSREEILYQLLQNSSITMSDYLYLTNKQKPVEIHIDNPNIQKLDPNVVVETRTDGTGDIDVKKL